MISFLSSLELLMRFAVALIELAVVFVLVSLGMLLIKLRKVADLKIQGCIKEKKL